MSIRTQVLAGLASLALASSGMALAAPAPAAPSGPPRPPAIEALPTFNDPAAIPLSTTSAAVPDQWTKGPDGSRLVRNVTVATLTPVLPDPAKATGAAVIIAPGGGFLLLAIDKEGYRVARWLADRGVAAFVLKYRLNPMPTDTEAFANMLAAGPPRGAATPPGTPRRFETPAPALEDARAAMRLVRARAASWGIDPKRVGFMGFSAGAVTTLDLAFKSPPELRPDFIGSIYGPMYAQEIPADAPPMFNALAIDDGLMDANDVGLIFTYRRASRPVEFHLYQNGGHGFGMDRRDRTSDLWIDQFYAWMQARDLLKR